ncbi:uncharacterized protein LOC144658459 [Oculina patagonica]
MANLLQLLRDIFTVTVLLALSFGSIGHVGARPQGTSGSSSSSTAQGSVTCDTIQTEIYAQKPFDVSSCSNCTQSVRTVTFCNVPFTFHVCKDGCEPTKTTFDMEDLVECLNAAHEKGQLSFF